eukprot:TCALIF_12572-PA protein Name:"Similar to LETM1 LETM1 and EF-hand domain-containing protein 1, mitochondrial (Gallus gallus)" AED:0.08 eAED:0.08 QI:0/0/0/0.5/1/1/4/0/871
MVYSLSKVRLKSILRRQEGQDGGNPQVLTSPSPDHEEIEVTVQRLRQKQVDQLSQLSSVQDLEKKVEYLIAKAEKDENASKALEKKDTPKKSLWVRIVDEVKHYYSGFKLLFLDVKVSSQIIWKVLQGNTLTRREKKQLVRTVSDLFRLLPFSVFILVPFMELLLPVALKLFPGMLPSTFTTSSDRDVKMRRTLKAKLEYARFLQETLDEMAPTSKNDRSSQSARDFTEFYQNVKTQGLVIKNEDILKFSKLFEDEITLDNMTRTQLVALCRLLELTPMGTNNFLRLQLEMKLRQLKTDDRVIKREGVDDMDVRELQNACRERGMRAYGLSEKQLRRQLEQWLDLSLNNNVPPSLLLLSRTLFLPEDSDSTAKIAASISALPESAATVTSAAIGESEGKVRNVERLKIIKEEQRKIEEEAAEEKRQRLIKEETKKEQEKKTAYEKKTADDKKTADEKNKEEEEDSPKVERVQEDPHKDVKMVEEMMKEKVAEAKNAILKSAAKSVDSTKIPESVLEEPSFQRLVRDAKIAMQNDPKKEDEDGKLMEQVEDSLEKVKQSPESEKDEISSEDLSDLKTAIESLGKVSDEAEMVGNLKKELQDYEEDIEELKFIKAEANRFDLQESKGAKRLFSRVNKILSNVDRLVDNLEMEKNAQKEQAITIDEAKEQFKDQVQSKGKQRQDNEGKDDSLVTIQELIDAVQKLKATTDSTKVEKIAMVLSKMDDDSDGMIKVDHVLKVIELLGTEQIQLNSKQIKKILDMLEKEDMLEIEANIEEVLGSTPSDEEASSSEAESRGKSVSADKSKPDDGESKTNEAQTVSRANPDIAKDMTENEPEDHIKELFETPSPRDQEQERQAMKLSPPDQSGNKRNGS